jgi:chromosome segregation ATPase
LILLIIKIVLISKIETERSILYKKCEELSASESNLRSQLIVYAERYQEFQNAIQQSSEMIISCQAEMEKMGKKIKQLENERNEFRHRCETAEQNPKKSTEDV